MTDEQVIERATEIARRLGGIRSEYELWRELHVGYLQAQWCFDEMKRRGILSAEGTLASSVTVTADSDLLNVVESMARQHCFCNGSVTDSGATTANAEALRALAKRGRFRITVAWGSMVLGYWPEHDPHNVVDSRVNRNCSHVGGWRKCAECGRDTWNTENGLCIRCRPNKSPKHDSQKAEQGNTKDT